MKVMITVELAAGTVFDSAMAIAVCFREAIVSEYESERMSQLKEDVSNQYDWIESSVVTEV